MVTGEPQLRTLCRLHRFANHRKKSFWAVNDIIGWVKWFVLSLAGVMKLFRKAILQVFIAKAKKGIQQRRLPSQTQRQSNEAFLRKFVDVRKRKDKVSFATILSMMPGHWEDHKLIELFPPEGMSAARWVHLCARKYRKAALGAAPQSFPSSKWQKTRDTPDFLARLTLHGILLDVYRFLLPAMRKASSKV